MIFGEVERIELFSPSTYSRTTSLMLDCTAGDQATFLIGGTCGSTTSGLVDVDIWRGRTCCGWETLVFWTIGVLLDATTTADGFVWETAGA